MSDERDFADDEEAATDKWDDMTDEELLQFDWQGQQDGQGLCLIAAFQWAIRHPEVTLVHARLNGEKLHAFCVHDDRVFDITLGPTNYTWDKATYFKSVKPTEARYYTHEQAVVISSERGPYEFWEFPKP